MEVILLQDVDQLGRAGERVRVREGYSRNFLIPRRLAVPATEGGLKFLEAKKKQAEQKRLSAQQSARELAEKISQWKCVLKVRTGAEGKLFGSVTRNDVAAALEQKGMGVDRRKIDLPEPIHEIGEYQVRIRLHADVHAVLNVAVAQA